MTNQPTKPSQATFRMSATLPAAVGAADGFLLAPFGAAPALAAPAFATRPPQAALPPRGTPAHIDFLYQLALTLVAMSFQSAAAERLQRLTALAGDHAEAWRLLASLLRLEGRDEEAAEAEAQAAASSTGIPPAAAVTQTPEDPVARERELKTRLDGVPENERATFLHDVLFADPRHAPAMRFLAEQERRGGDLTTAGSLLRRALQLCPAYLAARWDYTNLLTQQRNHLGVMEQTAILLDQFPENAGFRTLRAHAAVHMEQFDEALRLYQALLAQDSENPRLIMSYGNVLKALGRRTEAVDAYRRLLAVSPGNGSGYFGLSELKSDALTEADIADMRGFLAQGIADITSRKCMAYALGQSLEQAQDYEASFAAYALGARICQEELAATGEVYRPKRIENRLARMRATFTRDALDRRVARPSATTPIFIVGLPRAGSTLVEQILASHTLVESTRELPVVPNLTREIAMSRALLRPNVYPERVMELDSAELDALGEACLAGMAAYRSTNRPYVIDKRPWNWIDAAFIGTILPQAKFIDIRRAPMAAGFAMFKQLLPAVAAFTFDLSHLGHYYREYAGFMTHLDSIMPGRILHVSYERLILDTEAEIRRMLDFCALPFEENCLNFWQTDRGIMTPSAEQVRRPIFHDALHQWQHYKPWLTPLQTALGDLAEA